MGNKSLIANWIAKCDKELDSNCEGGDCRKCKYYNICLKVIKLNAKFTKRGYLK